MPRRRKGLADHAFSHVTPLQAGDEVWGYLRVSSDDQADKLIPIMGQEREVRTWADHRGLVLTRIYRDEALSGKSDERGGFLEMVAEAKRLRPSALLVWDWKRFARNQEDAWHWKSILRHDGTDIITINGEIPDVPGPLRYVVESIIHFAAEQDLIALSLSTRRGMRELAKLGYIPSGCEPARGYMVQITTLEMGGRERQARRWVQDPEVWPFVLKAWRMKLDGVSNKRIWAEIGLYKSPACLTTMFRNQTYKGELHFGRDGDEVIIPVPAAVTPEEWQVVQDRRPQIGDGSPRRKASTYLLSGLLICRRCGAAMVGHFSVGTVRADGYRRQTWRYYICSGRQNRRDCQMPRLKADAVEAAVLEVFRDQVLTEASIAESCRAMAAMREGERPLLEQRHAGLQSELEAAEGKLSRLLDALEEGTSGAITVRVREREQEVARLRLAAEDVRRQAVAANQPAMLDIAAQRARLERFMREGPPGDLRAMLADYGLRVTADEETLTIEYAYPFEVPTPL